MGVGVDRYGTMGVGVDRYGTMGVGVDRYGTMGVDRYGLWGLTGMDYGG